MKTNIVIEISPPIPYLAKFWFLSHWPKFCWKVKLQDSLTCNISRKKQMSSKLKLSFWLCIARHDQSTQIKKFAYLCNISRKTWGKKLFLYLQINTKVFYKFIVSFWVCIAGHAQSTQNYEFAISLQYPKENLKDDLDFFGCK